jgi:hypothetical protein
LYELIRVPGQECTIRIDFYWQGPLVGGILALEWTIFLR